MKKLVLAVFVIGFGFFSCSLNPDTTVINDSSFSIVFRYSKNDTVSKTLPPKTSMSSKYFFSGIIIQEPEKRVTQNRSGGAITVQDLHSWEVRVKNESSNAVTLSAGDWMENIDIPPNGDFADDSAPTGLVYTKTPVFTVASDTVPYDVQWQFVDPYFYVVIRN